MLIHFFFSSFLICVFWDGLILKPGLSSNSIPSSFCLPVCWDCRQVPPLLALLHLLKMLVILHKPWVSKAAGGWSGEGASYVYLSLPCGPRSHDSKFWSGLKGEGKFKERVTSMWGVIRAEETRNLSEKKKKPDRKLRILLVQQTRLWETCFTTMGNGVS